jgi:hypothetical protein
MTPEAICELVDARKCVPLALFRDGKRACLVYSRDDDRYFVVIHSVRDGGIVTVLALHMWSAGAISEQSSEAVLARDLAMGLVNPDTRVFQVDRRVRAFDEETATPATLAALTTSRERAQEHLRTLARRQVEDRERASFAKSLHTVPDRKTHRNRPPNLTKLEHERFVATMKRYSGQTAWTEPPSFTMRLTVAERPDTVTRLPKRMLCDPIEGIINDPDFVHIILELAVEQAFPLLAITGITLFVGERAYPLEHESVVWLQAACRQLDER